MPIEGTLSKLADLKEDEIPEDPHEKLDQIELVDYLKN
jgi:hypothetical protein